MAIRAIILNRVAPHLALGREQVGILREVVQVASLGICSAVGEEILLLIVPDIRIAEVAGILRLGIEYHRVARHLIYLVAHLHTLHGDKVVGCRVVVAALRLHKALALLHIAATIKLTHLRSGVKRAVVGVHHRIAIHNLDKLGEYRRAVAPVVILRAIAIDICRILVDEHIAEALEALVRVAHSTIGQDYRSVVVRREVTHENKDRRVAIVDKIGVVGNHIHHPAPRRVRLRGCPICRRVDIARRKTSFGTIKECSYAE